jgi:hypothetical protein
VVALRKRGLGRQSIAETLTDELGFKVGESLIRGALRLLARDIDDQVQHAFERDCMTPLIAHATPLQVVAIEALLELGSVEAASEALGVTVRALRKRFAEARRRAAKAGYSPAHDMESEVPDGFSVKGVSTYYKVAPDGSRVPVAQWVKTKADEEHRFAVMLDAMQEALAPVRGAADPIEQRLPEVPRTVHAPADLLVVYPMGDPHLGMYSWAAETGNDFDLDIGEALLFAAADQLVDVAPPADQALVINLGDFFHSDNNSNRTSRSGHALDVDTRWAKVLAVGIRVMRRIIDRALEKHRIVRVINEIGNHDDHSAVMLSLALGAYYEREPRVEIDMSPERFHWHRFGKNLIGVTHGDGCKITKLPLLMAHDRPEDWGECPHRRWYTGHVHSDRSFEDGGVTVETYRTLAGRDSWTHASGYRAGRDMKCDVLHRERGFLTRHIAGIEQLEPLAPTPVAVHSATK